MLLQWGRCFRYRTSFEHREAEDDCFGRGTVFVHTRLARRIVKSRIDNNAVVGHLFA